MVSIEELKEESINFVDTLKGYFIDRDKETYDILCNYDINKDFYLDEEWYSGEHNAPYMGTYSLTINEENPILDITAFGVKKIHFEEGKIQNIEKILAFPDYGKDPGEETYGNIIDWIKV